MFVQIVPADMIDVGEITSTNMTMTNITMTAIKSNMAPGAKSRILNVIARPTDTTPSDTDGATPGDKTSDASGKQIKDECLPGMF